MKNVSTTPRYRDETRFFTYIDLSLLKDGVALGYSIPKFKPLTPITISKADLPDRSMWNIM